MVNEKIANLFSEMAFLMELGGENPFKVRAFTNGAQVIEDAKEDIAKLAKAGRLAELKGVGKGLAAAIGEYLETGTVKEYEKLKSAYPEGLLELRDVPGLGPKRIKTLYDELEISSLAELEYAVSENRLVELKGFGAKTQAKIQEALVHLKANRGRMLLPRALDRSLDIRAALAKLPGVKRAEETGELRRRLETIGSLDFLLETEKTLGATAIEKALLKLEVEIADAQGGSGLLFAGKLDGVDLRVYGASAANFAALDIQLTGSEDFLAKLPKSKAKGGFTSEEKFFQDIGLPWIPPEAREGDPREAASHTESLVEEKDIRGVFHAHTTASDGTATLAEMAEKCQELGLEYLGISEHSQSAGYAGGLKPDDILRQREEIERLNAKYKGFKIFHGIESDIKNDGALDYPEKILKEFDFVIASLHGNFQMPRAEMTARVCAAISHPRCTWLGHATGRLLLGRRGVDLDMEAVLEAAGKAKKSIELNANPYRLDLDWRHLRRARELKVSIGIFPDAHSTGGLEDYRWGVLMARKAGLGKADVVNTKPLKEMEKWLSERRY